MALFAGTILVPGAHCKSLERLDISSGLRHNVTLTTSSLPGGYYMVVLCLFMIAC